MGGPQPIYGPNDLLSTEEAAAVLGINEGTLRRWRYRGKGPPFADLQGTIRFRYAVLMAWVDEHQHRPTVPPPPRRGA